MFSTLHTNDAAGAVTRLLDMGIEPFLVASSVDGLVAQRLVRRLCPACRRPRNVDEDFLHSVGFPVERLDEGTIYEAVRLRGMPQHRLPGPDRASTRSSWSTTTSGRWSCSARSSNVIKQEALRHGMRTLRDDGWIKVLRGVTTVEEVLRVSEEDEALTET